MASQQEEGLVPIDTDTLTATPELDSNPPGHTPTASAPDQADAPASRQATSTQGGTACSQDTPVAISEAGVTSPRLLGERDQALSCLCYTSDHAGTSIMMVEQADEESPSTHANPVQQPLAEGLEPGTRHGPGDMPTWGPEAEPTRSEPGSAAGFDKLPDVDDTDEQITEPTHLDVDEPDNELVDLFETYSEEDFRASEIDSSGCAEGDEPEAVTADDSATSELEAPDNSTEAALAIFRSGTHLDEDCISDLDRHRAEILDVLERYRSHSAAALELLDINTNSLGVTGVEARLKQMREWLAECMFRNDGGDEKASSGTARGDAESANKELRHGVEMLRPGVGDSDAEVSAGRDLGTVHDVGGYRMIMEEHTRLKEYLEDLKRQRYALQAENLRLREARDRVAAERREEKEDLKKEVADLKRNLDASEKHVFQQVSMIIELDDKVEKLEGENTTLKDELCKKEYLELKERHQTDRAKKEVWEDLCRENAVLKAEVAEIQQLREDKETLQAKNLTLEAEIERLEIHNSELLVQVSEAEERRRLREEIQGAGVFDMRKMIEAVAPKQRKVIVDADHEKKLQGKEKDEEEPEEVEDATQGQSSPCIPASGVSNRRIRKVGGHHKQQRDEAQAATKEDTPQSPAWEEDSLAPEDIYGASPSGKQDKRFW
ncbi:hypothetical protein BR93DRAFT_964462 [Coniochaeta sp. PMI_546]|nr:hypothetical protein BR93DRAFT_964462 [Coniochaeta sp. PMI_546]